jgi:DNA-binding CsgD family transcriptional regulator
VLVLIADEIHYRSGSHWISYKTADSHRSRILEKLGVHETAGLVRGMRSRASLVEA